MTLFHNMLAETESERLSRGSNAVYQKPEGATINMSLSLAHPLRGLDDIIAGDNTLPVPTRQDTAL